MAAQLEVHERLVQHLNQTMRGAVERADDAQHSYRDAAQKLDKLKAEYRSMLVGSWGRGAGLVPTPGAAFKTF